MPFPLLVGPNCTWPPLCYVMGSQEIKQLQLQSGTVRSRLAWRALTAGTCKNARVQSCKSGMRVTRLSNACTLCLCLLFISPDGLASLSLTGQGAVSSSGTPELGIQALIWKAQTVYLLSRWSVLTCPTTSNQHPLIKQDGSHLIWIV